MKLTCAFLAGISLLAMGSVAQAADLMIESQPAPVMMADSGDWSGFYAGFHVGYGTGDFSLDAPFIDEDDEEEDIDGFIGGVQIGYNIQTGDIVFGIQTDLSASGISADEDGDGDDDTIDWLGSTTGRIGFAAGSFMPYVKAGIAYGGGTGYLEDDEDSNTQVGGTAGVGVEAKLADNMSVFAEYDYYGFDDETYEFDAADIDVGADLNVVKVGLNFSF